ncbi:EAL domain-containing protein [Sulfurimonas sp.]
MHKIIIFLALVIFGLLGNIFNIEMFFGVNQIFGSVFVLLAAWYFPLRITLLIAIIVQGYTYYLWGHPYAYISFVLEALTVGFLLKYRIKNIFIADAIYWLFIGVWLVPIFYGDIMGFADVQVELITLKQVTNGILNALIATLISILIIRYSKMNIKTNLREIVFSMMLSLISLSLYISANIMTEQYFRTIKENVSKSLQQDAAHLKNEIDDFSERILGDIGQIIDSMSLTTINGSKLINYIYINRDKKELLYSKKDGLKPDELFKPFNKTCTNNPLIFVQNKKMQLNLKYNSTCLTVGISLEKFRDFIKKQTLIANEEILLLDGEDIISTTSTNLITTKFLGNERQISENLYQLFPDKKMPKMKLWKNSSYLYKVEHPSFKNYTILVKHSFGKYIDELQKIYILTFKVLLVFILISSILVYFFTLIIIRPILKLQNLSKNLTDKVINDKQLLWPTSNIEEIMSLSESFKNITNSLKSIFQENEERYKKMLNSSNDMVLVIDMKSKKIEDSNLNYKNMFGDETNINSSIQEIISKNDSILNDKVTNHSLIYLRDKDDVKIPIRADSQYLNIKNKNITILTMKDVSDEIEANNKINTLAYYDNLTKLPNRTLFEDRMQHAILNSKRTNLQVALMFIDLDNFKIINDTFGHRAGDKLLKDVAQRIQSNIRENDTLSRIGGDEFTLILENIENRAYIADIANKIIKSFRHPFEFDAKETHSSLSIGIAIYPDDGDNLSDMMKNADTAMYRVKELGKNNFEFFTHSMNIDALEHLSILVKLKKALDDEILELHYQPQVCSNSGQITGAEALLRWNDSEKGFISPELFIQLAENSGLMGRIEKFVLNTGSRQQIIWQKMGINIQMSLNISNQQFNKSEFVKDTLNIFDKHDVDPKTIDLELTERIVMDSEESFNKIQALKNAGFEISLDDFGTGQSSLSYLKKFNIDKLKIDKSFIDDIPHDEQSCSIVKAIVSLSDAMGMKIVAEGVEESDQLDFLNRLGSYTYQGWYFSKALPAKEFEELYFSTKI